MSRISQSDLLQHGAGPAIDDVEAVPLAVQIVYHIEQDLGLVL